MILLEVNDDGSADSQGDGLNGDEGQGGGQDYNEKEQDFYGGDGDGDGDGDGLEGDGDGAGGSYYYIIGMVKALTFEQISINASLTITYKDKES